MFKANQQRAENAAAKVVEVTMDDVSVTGQNLTFNIVREGGDEKKSTTWTVVNRESEALVDVAALHHTMQAIAGLKMVGGPHALQDRASVFKWEEAGELTREALEKYQLINLSQRIKVLRRMERQLRDAGDFLEERLRDAEGSAEAKEAAG